MSQLAGLIAGVYARSLLVSPCNRQPGHGEAVVGLFFLLNLKFFDSDKAIDNTLNLKRNEI